MMSMTILLAYRRNEFRALWSGYFFDEILIDPFKGMNEIQEDSIYSVHCYGPSSVVFRYFNNSSKNPKMMLKWPPIPMHSSHHWYQRESWGVCVSTKTYSVDYKHLQQNSRTSCSHRSQSQGVFKTTPPSTSLINENTIKFIYYFYHTNPGCSAYTLSYRKDEQCPMRPGMSIRSRWELLYAWLLLYRRFGGWGWGCGSCLCVFLWLVRYTEMEARSLPTQVSHSVFVMYTYGHLNQ
jgi:hypothetical protein